MAKKSAATPDKAPKETPLMKQYNEIKNKYPDACLLFRVGDFYETFGEDAVRAAGILGITLTKRGAGSETETALAGFPHHSINTYLPKLVKAGLRVAICDQLEDPKMTKTIVKRGVTELVTPGVSMNDEVLQSKSNNFLASVHFGKKMVGVSFLDVSTGEFLVSQGNEEYIDKLLQNFRPSEILIPKQFKNQFNSVFGDDFHTFFLEDWVYKEDYALESLTKHFQTNSLKGFGVEELTEGLIASGAILYYLSETQHNKIQHITNIQRIAEDAYVWMDKFTIRNLELYHSYNPNAVTLLDVIDKTLSPMGARLLKRWLALPLKDISKIRSRHEVISYLKTNPEVLQQIQYQIKQISDLERLISKVATGKISPREVNFLKDSLDAIIPIKTLALESSNEALRVIGDSLHACELLREKIKTTIQEDAPVSVNKGNAIAVGVHSELDELRAISSTGKGYLEELEQRESAASGIPSLKVSFNNVFGYYIEVRNTHKDKVPAEWIRKQTLVNAERYITEELKEYESKILGAEEKIHQLETQLFEQLVNWIATYIKHVQLNANLIAQLDCLTSFTQLAIDNKYVCPDLDESFDLEIKEGRHPVIEKQLPVGVPYISNDVYLDRETQQIIMITGPNMAGKSALLRQTALIVLMAQIGCFVPAQAATIGIVDKIFTRVGASDNLLEEPSRLTAENRKELVSGISVAALRLNQQVENLLSMSRLESGFIQPKKDWCDMNELIYDVINRLDQQLKNHQTVVSIEEGLPLYKLDYVLMEQVLYNLLYNAAVYTPAYGDIFINVSNLTDRIYQLDTASTEHSPLKKETNCLSITIEDRGPGFPPEEIEKVFDKFYRLSNTRTGGTGLGLSIVKGFVEAHNGKVVLENVPHGARFTIMIPAETSFINNLKNE